VIVADGATGGLARTLGFGAHTSRLVALRGYAATARDLPNAYGCAYARSVLPGYAWIFPVAPRRANVGLVVTEATAKRAAGDLRGVLRAWLARSAWARGLLGDEPELEDVHGGVIPTGRARRVAGPVFLAGDAAGTADPLTAEGVSQALACGRAAARALIDANGDVAAAGRQYAATFGSVDRNAREALRMRAMFAAFVEPLIALAAANARAARVLSAVAYTAKDESWVRAMLRETFAR
jgi:flavin-dependent dehydrogenase